VSRQILSPKRLLHPDNLRSDMKQEREIRELRQTIEKERDAPRADLASRSKAQTVYVAYHPTQTSVGALEDALVLLDWVLA